VLTEIQADCFAGTFFQFARQAGVTEPGDVEEAAQVTFSSAKEISYGLIHDHMAHLLKESPVLWAALGSEKGIASTKKEKS
jgi:hypothetical protein